MVGNVENVSSGAGICAERVTDTGGVYTRNDVGRAGEGEPARIVGDPRRAEGARGGASHNVHASRVNPQRLYSHQLKKWYRNLFM